MNPLCPRKSLLELFRSSSAPVCQVVHKLVNYEVQIYLENLNLQACERGRQSRKRIAELFKIKYEIDLMLSDKTN